MNSLTVLFILSLSSASTGLKEIDVQADRNAQLECQGPKKAKLVLLEWKRLDLLSDGYVFFYRDGHLHKTFQHPTFRDRVELRDPQMKNGNMSIILYNTTIKDTGTYECRIIAQNIRDSSSPTFEIKHEIKLTVVPPGHTQEVTAPRDEENEENKDVGNEDERDGGFIGLAGGLLALVVIVIVVFSYNVFSSSSCCKHKSSET
ncbi:uncharacterized protein LOC116316648 [Oreochromis aureus]|uniref:uncharacterized protein LOC116316648 n=1 Tax=Oreochromis aureus TaxID=47969 RepID=UPI0012BD4EA1|nr:uncharacterized protein LOC116316648 [Oreochromis aureus]